MKFLKKLLKYFINVEEEVNTNSSEQINEDQILEDDSRSLVGLSKNFLEATRKLAEQQKQENEKQERLVNLGKNALIDGLENKTGLPIKQMLTFINKPSSEFSEQVTIDSNKDTGRTRTKRTTLDL